MAGATARKDARYAAELVVTAERRPQPLREVGRRTRAAAKRCSAVAAAVKMAALMLNAAQKARATRSSTRRAAGSSRSGRTVRHR